MRLLRTFLLGAAVLAIVITPRHAAAQGFVSPFIGTTLSSPSPIGERPGPGYGIAFGSIGAIFGSDFEIAWFPDAISLAASTMIGPRIRSVKVYFAFGGGDTILSASPLTGLIDPSLANLSAHFFTLNTGG